MSRILKVNVDAMSAEFPVEGVLHVFKFSKERDSEAVSVCLSLHE